MSFKEGKYNMKAVSQKLGIRPGTLRAWERRYQVICPERNESGHRLYTEQHIAILQWLIEKVNEGFTIKQAVELREAGSFNDETDLPLAETVNYINQFANRIAEALLGFDEQKAQGFLNQAYSLYSIDRVTIELFGLVQTAVAKRLSEPTMTKAHEQFCLSFLETKVSAVSLTLPVDSVMPRALLFCGPNESDVLWLRIFSFYLKRKGMEVVYLGAGISIEDVELIVEQWNPSLFAVSCMAKENMPESIRTLKKLSEEHPSAYVGLIGSGFTQLDDLEKKGFAPLFIGKSRADWELWLEQLSLLK